MDAIKSHELLRQYAYEKLETSSDCDAIKSAHSEYYLCFMEDRQADIHGRRQVEALNEISIEFENVRAAWHWALDKMNYDRIGGAVETLCVYLHFRSRWKQDSQMVIDAQARFAPKSGENPHIVWAMVAARNYMNNPDPLAILNQSIEIAQAHSNQAEVGLYSLLLGHYYAQRGENDAAIQQFEATIPMCEVSGDKYHLAGAYGFAALLYRLKGEYETSVSYNDTSLKIRRAIGDIDGQILATAELSNTMFITGNLQAAENYRHEAILLAEQIGSPWTIAWQKWELAMYHLLGVRGDLQATEAILEETQQYLRSVVHAKSGTGYNACLKSLVAVMHKDFDTAQTYGEIAREKAKGDAWFPIYTWGSHITSL